MKKVIGIITSGVLFLSGLLYSFNASASDRYSADLGNVCEVSRRNQELYDDFNGDKVDSSNWLIVDKSWGGNNGGLVPENVSVSGGTLKLEGHGNLYTGDIKGHNKSLGGKRTGAGIATRDYFASGSYEVIAKVAPVRGACSAIWTFMYEDNEYEITNHEIDIEMPTANSTHSEPSFECARFNTYITETKDNSQFMDLPYAVDDNNFHKYRFDWHTGSETESKRVDFFVDDIYICTSTRYVPTNASRLWIGLWFPCAQDKDHDGICETGWTGTADFDTAVFEIDSVRITPFLESGDTVQNESVPKSGWAPDSFPEDNTKENYEHVINGDFASGIYNWTLEGDAEIRNGTGILTSGSRTDTIKQIVNVVPKMTYTLSADFIINGPQAVLGVRKLNGCDNESVDVNSNGKAYVYYTPGEGVYQVEIYMQVLRYQNISGNALVDNVSFNAGRIEPLSDETTYVSETVVTDDSSETTSVSYITDIYEPEITTVSSSDDEAESTVTEQTVFMGTELIKNGTFDKKNNWKLSGSAKINDGKLVLDSGNDTDTAKQIIKVSPNTKYYLCCDICTEGTIFDLEVSDYNGKYTELKSSYSTSGKGVMEFTTGKKIKEITVTLHVLRYQDINNKVYIDNVSLKNC